MSLFRHYIIGPILIVAIGLGIMATRSSTSDADRVRAVVHDYRAGTINADPRICSRYMTAAGRMRARVEHVLADPESCEQQAARMAFTVEEKEAIGRVHIKHITFVAKHTKAIIKDSDLDVPEPLEPVNNGRPIVLLKGRDGHWRIDDLG